LLRLDGLDFNCAEQVQKAIDYLEPFENLAKQLNVTGLIELNKLWDSMRKAKSGDPTDFKELFISYLKKTKEASFGSLYAKD
jgi:hypothetical protein